MLCRPSPSQPKKKKKSRRLKKLRTQFNVLWLDPNNPDSFPLGLEDVLAEGNAPVAGGGGDTTERMLRAQMRADALQPLDDGDGFPRNTDSGNGPYPPETIDEAAQFLRLNVSHMFLCLSSYSTSVPPSLPPFFFFFTCRGG